MKVADLMNPKCITVYAGDTVQNAAEKMAEHNRGLVAVLNNMEEKKVVGVVTNKDIINKIVAKKKFASELMVSEIMVENFISVSPEANTTDAIMLMRKNNIKRVLVIENNMLQGIISSNDILDEMIKYKKELLDLAIDF